MIKERIICTLGDYIVVKAYFGGVYELWKMKNGQEYFIGQHLTRPAAIMKAERLNKEKPALSEMKSTG